MATETDFKDPNYQRVIEGAKELHPEWDQYSAWKSTQPAAPGTAPAPPTAPGQTPTPQNSQQALVGQATVGAQPQQGQQTTVAGAFQQSLLNKLSQGPITAQSPQVSPQIQANQLAEQRGFDRDRAMLAEQNAASGINNSGGANSMVRGLSQDRSQREGQFAGNAIADANRLQSAEILTALGLSGGLLSGIDSRDLQRYGIDTDAQLRREGLGASTSLGQGDLALRGELGRGNLNLGLASLLQNGQQFGQSLSSQNAQFGAGLNQSALLALLGGL